MPYVAFPIYPTQEVTYNALVPALSASPYDFAAPTVAAQFVASRAIGPTGRRLQIGQPHNTVVFRVTPPTGVTAYTVEVYEMSPTTSRVALLTLAAAMAGPHTANSPPIEVPRTDSAIALRLVDVTFGAVPTDPFVISWQCVMR